MPTFLSNDATLAYTHIAHDHAQPLLFLHGLGNDTAQGEAIFQENTHIDLYCLSQRGHGKSEMGPAKRLTFETLGEDVLHFADHLGIDRFFLAGISMGSAAAVSFAAQHPERLKGLLLLRPAWAGEAMDPATASFFNFVKTSLQTDKRGLSAFTEAKNSAAYQALDDEKKANFEKFRALFDDEAHFRYCEKFSIIPAAAPSKGMCHLSAIATPTICLSNKQDEIHPFLYGAYYARQMPHCIWREIPCKAEDEPAYNKAINAALEELLARYA